MRIRILIVGLFFLAANTCAGQSRVDMSGLLKEMVSYDEAAKWPAIPYTENQASSYDRGSVAENKPGWFAPDDRTAYIRTETVGDHKELVMMDADGPGVVVRFWLTTFKRAGKIRIYFDGQTKPTITVPAYDLMQSGLNLGKALLQPHSSYEAKEKGGSTLYLPLPYAKHCKITFEENEPDFQPRYYQINYRTYAPGTKVKTFTMAQVRQLEKQIKQTNDLLLNPQSVKITGTASRLDKTIAPQQTISLKLPAGTAAVRMLSIKVNDSKDNYDKLLRSLVLNITFDGQRTVHCPLGDFSGSGVGGQQLQSWYRTVAEDGTITCRWVMPYQKNATISIQNTGDEEAKLSVAAVTNKWRWDNRSMYFHTDWRYEKDVQIKKTEADKPFDWAFNLISGRGVFMGDSFAIFNHMKVWYGEGDQKLWADGVAFPNEFGTGTEDYYNTSWAPVVLYQTPFSNAPRADNANSFGENTFTRTRNLDRFTFNRSFRYTLEMMGWENGTGDCAATTYWYGAPGSKSTLIKP